MKIYIFNLFRKEYLYYFWIPRIIVSFIFIYFYQNIHITNEQWHPSSIFTPPDESVYLSSNLFNPLFSISIKFLNSIDNYFIIRFFLGEFISSFSCIALYEHIRQIVKINKLPLLIMALHPMLVIYGMRFCTENFSIMAVSTFIICRINEIKNFKLLTNIKYRINSITSQFLLSLFRAQSLPIVIGEFLFFIKEIFLKSIGKLRVKKIIFIFLLSFIFIVLLNKYFNLVNDNYKFVSVENIFDSNFPLKPKDIFDNICLNRICENTFFSVIFKTISLLIYLLAGLFFLTGARGRFTDMPWNINIFGYDINFFKTINQDQIDFINNFNQDEFIIKVIFPLIFFSVFHIIGLFFWIRKMNNISLKVSLFPLTICFVPLLLHPYMRYFIPLIPIASLGYGFILSNGNKKNILRKSI